MSDITVNEGEPISFNISASDSNGAPLTYTVTGLPEGATFVEVPAFPGAEGFGAISKGGRRGKVVKVTNLNFDGPGSFAAALELREPRIIVFDVSGVISGKPANYQGYKKHHRFYAADAPLTIAGQTAPGGGVTLEGELYLQRRDGAYPVDDAVVRFIRSRGSRPSTEHAFSAFGKRIILDHVSGSWGNDEDFGLTYVQEGTLQWSTAEASQGAKDPAWEPYPDIDEDGMNDRWEEKIVQFSDTDSITDLVYHVKPEDDLDSDGYTNIEEQNLGTNPLSADNKTDIFWVVNYDSDDDGMADWWEDLVIERIQADPNSTLKDSVNTYADVVPDGDLDADGVPNIKEYEGGMYPIPVYSVHNFGMIIGYTGKDISIHHNAFAHHIRRAPLSGVEVFDYRNNLVYDTAYAIISHPIDMNYQRLGERFMTNLIGNYFKPGPSDMKEPDDYYNYPGSMPVFIGEHPGRISMFENGNYFDMVSSPNGYLDIWNPGRLGISGLYPEEKANRTEPYPAPAVKTQTATEAYGLVSAHAGALPRDTVSNTTFDEIAARTGIWGKYEPAGGLMDGLIPGTAEADSDNDGMPDSWELSHGLDPADPKDAAVTVGAGKSFLAGYQTETMDRYQGYTFVEYYINELADKKIIAALIDNGYSSQDALLNLPGFGKKPQPIVSWTPDYNSAGTYVLTFNVSDGANTTSKTVTINVVDSNRSPFIRDRIYDAGGANVSNGAIVTVGQPVNLSIPVIDQENDGALTVTSTALPAGASLYSSGQKKIWSENPAEQEYDLWTLEWTPQESQVGVHEIPIVASDGVTSFEKLLKITVNAAGTSLILPVQLIPPATLDNPYSAALIALGGAAPYKFSTDAAKLPPGLALATDGSITGTPVQTGSYSFPVTVEDSSATPKTVVRTLKMSVDTNLNVESFAITTSAGPGGSISPSGEVSVQSGSNQIFTIDRASGFDVLDVKVDGLTVGPVSKYTFQNVTAAHTIEASFKEVTAVQPDNVIITASAGAGGSINPAGDVTVQIGSNKIFSIVPNSGFSILDVKVDGASAGAVSSFTFEKTTAPHTIQASFKQAPTTVAVTASAGIGGSITPSGAVSAEVGTSLNFSIAADANYQISDVKVDGASKGAVSSFTFTALAQNHTIAATFKSTSQQAAVQPIAGIRATNNRWPSSESMKSFAEDAIRLMGAQAEEEKALSVFRFIRMWTSRTNGNPPQERAFGESLTLDPLKVLNVYGAHWCDGLVRAMEVAWRATGGRAEKLVKNTHTQADVFWKDSDGVDRWHLFDVSDGWYVYDRTGSHIASPSEIVLDYSLVFQPSNGPVPATPNYWTLYGRVHTPHFPASEYVPSLSLRQGERLTLYWGNIGKPYLDNFDKNGALDFIHGPYPVTYANGVFEYDLNLSSASMATNLFEPAVNIDFGNGLASPQVHPKTASANSEFVVEIKSPYIIADAWIDADFVRLSAGDQLSIAVSTDGGATWKSKWQASTTGNISLAQQNIAEKFDVYQPFPAGLISPFGRYDYLLKVSMQAGGAISDVGVNKLKITTVTQHNMFSLPQVWPGKNTMTVNGDVPNGSALRVTYNWDDLAGAGRSIVAVVEAPPFAFDVNALGNAWEDVRSRSIIYEAEAATGNGNRLEVQEEIPAGLVEVTPAQAFGVDDIVGSAPASALKTVEEYILDLATPSKQVEALAGLMVLRDPSSLEAVKDVAFNSISFPQKEMAVQAMYLVGGVDALPYLHAMLEPAPEVQWKQDPTDKLVMLGQWYNISSLIGCIAVDAGDVAAAPYLTAVLDSIVANNDLSWWSHVGIIRSLGQLGDSQAVPSIRAFLSRNADAAATAIWALGELKDLDSAPSFRALLGSSSYVVKIYRAAEALGKLEDQQSVPLLVGFLGHEDEDFRAYAAEALGRINDSSVVPDLEAMLQKETFPWVRAKAQTAIDKLLQIVGRPSPPSGIKVQ